MVKNACNAEVIGPIPESGRSPGEGNGNPLQCSCLENPYGQRVLVGHSPWGRKDLDTAERLTVDFVPDPGQSARKRGMEEAHWPSRVSFLWSMSGGCGSSALG